MVLVTRRGAIGTLERGGELAGAAAVACVRAFADDPFLGPWRARPGKVMLRARGGSGTRSSPRRTSSPAIPRASR